MSGRRAVRIAVSAPARLRGLLFRDPSWLGKGGVLVLAPCSSVHTLFMRHPLDIAFVDVSGIVVKSARSVPPWQLMSARRAAIVLERFADPNERWYEPGDAIVL